MKYKVYLTEGGETLRHVTPNWEVDGDLPELVQFMKKMQNDFMEDTRYQEVFFTEKEVPHSGLWNALVLVADCGNLQIVAMIGIDPVWATDDREAVSIIKNGTYEGGYKYIVDKKPSHAINDDDCILYINDHPIIQGSEFLCKEVAENHMNLHVQEFIY